MHPKLTWRLMAVSIFALALAACSAGGTATASPSAAAPPSAAGGSAAAGAVDVKLQEWAVVPASTTAAAGDVMFHVSNTGPEDTHEFVVIKTDLDPGALPTEATGAVSESGTGMEVIGEIEDIAVGSSQDLTSTLAAGKYVLLCNIYDETEKEAH
jgi:uncharacterized cupredoxin-like copper-binding protein